jgi:outer membrane protein assembly factor BamA
MHCLNREGNSGPMKSLACIFLGLATCGLALAQTESRADLIDSARTQRDADLSPEQPPRAEARIKAIEESVPYRLVTGEMDGFGIGFGTIIPGSGFALRPRYTRTDLLGGRLTLRIEALGSINQSYLGGLDLAMPNLFSGHAFMEFSVVHRDISEMPYYGPGPNSRKTGRSDYRLEDTNAEFRPGVRVYRGLRASLIGSYLADNVGPGHATRYISTEKQYGPDAAPGIDHQTGFLRGGGRIEYDWRDQTSGATSGGKYSAQYVRYLDQNLGRYSFMRVDLDAWQYIPLFNHTRVIALHAASSLTDTNDAQVVPFYLQPTLGGPDTLRGFRFDRFYGNNSTMATAEYHWDASPILQMVAFADGGKVFNNWQEWNFHNIQTDVGFGFRFRGRTTKNVFRFDTGFSHEGFQIWFGMNNALQSRAQ